MCFVRMAVSPTIAGAAKHIFLCVEFPDISSTPARRGNSCAHLSAKLQAPIPPDARGHAFQVKWSCTIAQPECLQNPDFTWSQSGSLVCT